MPGVENFSVDSFIEGSMACFFVVVGASTSATLCIAVVAFHNEKMFNVWCRRHGRIKRWGSHTWGRKGRVGVAKEGSQEKGGGRKGRVAKKGWGCQRRGGKKVVAVANEIRNDIPTHSLRPPD